MLVTGRAAGWAATAVELALVLGLVAGFGTVLGFRRTAMTETSA